MGPHNQRLYAAQQRKHEARTEFAANNPRWTESPFMRWCKLFRLQGIGIKPPLFVEMITQTGTVPAPNWRVEIGQLA